MDFGEIIIHWYHQHKRDLPWRNTKDPYKIWLSEIILQQTRVDQGLAYYHRFVKQYPDVKKLAVAKEDAVLKLWQGLGYLHIFSGIFLPNGSLYPFQHNE